MTITIGGHLCTLFRAHNSLLCLFNKLFKDGSGKSSKTKLLQLYNLYIYLLHFNYIRVNFILFTTLQLQMARGTMFFQRFTPLGLPFPLITTFRSVTMLNGHTFFLHNDIPTGDEGIGTTFPFFKRLCRTKLVWMVITRVIMIVCFKSVSMGVRIMNRIGCLSGVYGPIFLLRDYIRLTGLNKIGLFRPHHGGVRFIRINNTCRFVERNGVFLQIIKVTTGKGVLQIINNGTSIPRDFIRDFGSAELNFGDGGHVPATGSEQTCVRGTRTPVVSESV